MTSHWLGRSSSSYPRCGEAPNGRQPHDEPQQLTRTRLLASSESRRSLQPTRRGSYCDSRAGPVVGSFVPGRPTDESRVCTHTRRTFTCVHSLIESGYDTGSTACAPSALVRSSRSPSATACCGIRRDVPVLPIVALLLTRVLSKGCRGNHQLH